MSAMNTTAALPSIAGLLRGYSIELAPSDSTGMDVAIDRLDPGTEVSLTWIPGSDPMNMIAPAARLRKAGHLPMPHIGARHVESQVQLEELVERLAGEAAVDRILIVGGDRAKPAGPYGSTLAVMQSGVLQKAGIVQMTVGGFPEGNPHIQENVLSEALASKVDFARATGIQLSITTQFAFKAEPIIEWLRRIRNSGIEARVRIGLAGPARLMTLALYAVRCGIGNSLHVLTENPSFAKALVDKGPEPIIREIASFMRDGNREWLGIAGFHFYVFGGLRRTIDWIDSERSLNPASAHT
jgi:methylenetetrahydrofolate reductase (NADPH)